MRKPVDFALSATCTCATCCVYDIFISSEANFLPLSFSHCHVQIRCSPHSSTPHSLERQTCPCFDSSLFSWLSLFLYKEAHSWHVPIVHAMNLSATCHVRSAPSALNSASARCSLQSFLVELLRPLRVSELFFFFF